MWHYIDSFFNAVLAGESQAIVTLVAIYFVLAGSYGLAYCIWIRSWPATEGKLTTAGLERWGPSMRAHEQDYIAHIQYMYSVGGVAFEGSRLSPTFVMVSANSRFVLNWQMKGIKKLGVDQVEVIYNPRNPRKSFLIKPGLPTFSLLMLCILVALLVLLY